MRIKQNASITVYLSLTLLLLLSLIMTVIEGARRTATVIFTERAMSTAMDSVLAGFFGPLMDEYHILGLYLPYEETADIHYDIAQRVRDYMLYTLKPRLDLDNADDLIYIYPSSIESIEVVGSTGLADYQGEIIINEIAEYMKYRIIGNAAEFFLDKASLLEQPGKVSVLYEEKSNLEEELVAIDEGILALMKYIDGISADRNGIERAKGGGLKTVNTFVKKLLYDMVSMENTGINNETVFKALKDKYINPGDKFKAIADNFSALEMVLNTVNSLEIRLAENRSDAETREKEIEKLKKDLSKSGNTDPVFTETTESKIREVEKTLALLDDEAVDITMDIDSYMMQKKKHIDSIIYNGKEIYNLVTDCLGACEQAIRELEKIISSAEKALPMIDSYEQNLNSKKEDLEDSIYESLKEGLDEILKYRIDNNDGYDFYRMKQVLTSNKGILEAGRDYLDKGFDHLSTENHSEAKRAFSNASVKLKTYDTKELRIDYSTIADKDEDAPDYPKGIKDLIDNGIMSLVIDTKNVSEKRIDHEGIPSAIYGISKEKEGFSFKNLLKRMKIGAKESKTGDLFDNFGDYGIGSLVGSYADEILERLLVQEYIKEHFYSYPMPKEDTAGRKPSALSYEMEYLIYGKSTDKENLEDVIERLILIRTILNFTTILGDREKWREAKSIATSLVGFTGLSILVAITQGILMILLALSSALADVCALLNGKELPIIKKDIGMEYHEILMLTRDYIQRKASSYKEAAGFSYNDYLTLFLCLTNRKKLSYRMMDLIQENVNMRYDTDMDIQNVLFGYEINLKYNIKPLFTSLSFMKNLINPDGGSMLAAEAECSY